MNTVRFAFPIAGSISKYGSSRVAAGTWSSESIAACEGIAPFSCGGSPGSLPSGQRLVSVFNLNGTLASQPVGNLFPFTNTIAAGVALGLTPPQGWLFANLNLSAPSGPLGAIRQSWATWVQIPAAAPAVAGPYYLAPGIQLGNAAFANSPVVP